MRVESVSGSGGEWHTSFHSLKNPQLCFSIVFIHVLVPLMSRPQKLITHLSRSFAKPDSVASHHYIYMGFPTSVPMTACGLNTYHSKVRRWLSYNGCHGGDVVYNRS